MVILVLWDCFELIVTDTTILPLGRLILLIAIGIVRTQIVPTATRIRTRRWQWILMYPLAGPMSFLVKVDLSICIYGKLKTEAAA